MATLKLGILGFGEAGQSVATGFKKSATAEHPIEIATWDILLPSNEKGAPLKAAADRIGVRTVGSAAELAAASDIVISLVTTDQSLVAAGQIAKHLPKGILFLDCNSTSPGMKRDVAKTVEAAGGRSVEAAVMDLVPRWQHKVPMLVAGPAAEELIGKLAPFGVVMEAVGDRHRRRVDDQDVPQRVHEGPRCDPDGVHGRGRDGGRHRSDHRLAAGDDAGDGLEDLHRQEAGWRRAALGSSCRRDARSGRDAARTRPRADDGGGDGDAAAMVRRPRHEGARGGDPHPVVDPGIRRATSARGSRRRRPPRPPNKRCCGSPNCGCHWTIRKTRFGRQWRRGSA